MFGQRDNVPIKPDPTVVEDIRRLANAEQAETLFVGDSGVDMLTAQQAGVTAVGVTWGFRAAEELRTYNPDYLIAKPDEIRQLLGL